MDFIPAKESRHLLWFFDWYTRFLLRLRFRKIRINQEYTPGPAKQTVYFINHNYWWDGLLPVYLSRVHFNQEARALMEDTQMRRYPFFSKIGAFSINLKDPRASLRSLRYALESLERPNSCLFIYPEGKITPVSESRPEFKDGLSWLYQRTENVDFVPIAFYIDHSRHNKPDLIISIGKSVDLPKSLSKSELTNIFEKKVWYLLKECRKEIYLTSGAGH